jgi:hypothetical protein
MNIDITHYLKKQPNGSYTLYSKEGNFILYENLTYKQGKYRMAFLKQRSVQPPVVYETIYNSQDALDRLIDQVNRELNSQFNRSRFNPD